MPAPAMSGRSTGTSRTDSSISPARRAATLSTLQIVGDAQHLVGRLNTLCIGFVGALRGENLHHRIDNRDVRLFEHPEVQFRAVQRTGDDFSWFSRLARRFKNCAVKRAQMLRRRELRKTNVAKRAAPAGK